MATSRPRCPALDDPDMQWNYCPSEVGAIVVTAAFGILLIAHCLQAIIYKKRFCWVICMATAWETAGFVMRVLGARNPRSSNFSIGSNLLIILSPLWINAFAYMVMGRMIYYWLPSKSVWKIKARTMTKWFVWLDVITFFVQATGGSMLENDDASQAKLGMHIYMGGIGLQQAFLTLFVFVMIRFNIEVRREGIQRQASWKPQLYALYVALLLITIRIIFRLVEFTSGIKGPIPTNESFIYALEATPMVLAVAIFAIFHPGRSLIGPESEFSKMIVEKGKRRWWCCWRRTRTKIDPDFEMNGWAEDGAGPGVHGSGPHHGGDRHGGERKHRSRRYSGRRRSSKAGLWDPTRQV